MSSPLLHLAAQLDGPGFHPAAWRFIGPDAGRLFSGGYYAGLADTAEKAGLDFVLFDDGFELQSATDKDFRGRLDASLLAARLAPNTHHIGLVPTFTTTHAEPFHISKAIATIDHASRGRAGWNIDVSRTSAQADHFGRKSAAADPELYDEAADAATVVRRLWDSWEDDAEIRDATTGRFIDRDKLHYIDFTGDFFNVKGPSITPRPPQGHPLTVVRTGTAQADALAAAHADVIITGVGGLDDAAAQRRELRERITAAGRRPDDVTILTDLSVTLANDDAGAHELAQNLDSFAAPLASREGLSYVGGPDGLTDLITKWHDAEDFDGFVLSFAVLPTGLKVLADHVIPNLVSGGRFRGEYAEDTLRQRFGLDRAVNSFAVPA